MNNLKTIEVANMGLKERILSKIGDNIAQMAIDPRSCPGLFAYEPEMSLEMIEEASEKC